MFIKGEKMKNELIRTLPKCAWSQIHPRFETHDGCIVDLGCLGWNNDIEPKKRPGEKFVSHPWSKLFFGKKRVIGVDPQETPNEYAELFKGFVSSNFTGKADLSTSGVEGSMIKNPEGEFDVISWNDFKSKFNIKSISILKINIEGGEWELIESFTSEDFDIIDQITVSFHNFLPEYNNHEYKTKTQNCIKKIISNNYQTFETTGPGWKLFLKNY